MSSAAPGYSAVILDLKSSYDFVASVYDESISHMSAASMGTYDHT